MAQICEMLMLICFGLSWPANISKSIRSRTAKGKTIMFQIMVMLGYLSGLTGKFLTGNINYVVAFYIADILMVATDLVLTLRNMRLDRIRDREAALQGGEN